MTPAPGRGSPVPPVDPAAAWKVEFGSRAAAKAWREVCRTSHKKTLRKLLKQLQTEPRWGGAPRRHKRLSGSLGEVVVDGEACELWQHSYSRSGRVWFAIVDSQKSVRVTEVYPGHPKKTE